MTSTNFGFLARYDGALVAVATRAERYFYDDPVTCLMKLRQFGPGWALAMGRFGQVIAPLATGALMAAGLAMAQLMQMMAVLPDLAGIAVFLLGIAHRAEPEAAPMRGTAPGLLR